MKIVFSFLLLALVVVAPGFAATPDATVTAELPVATPAAPSADTAELNAWLAAGSDEAMRESLGQEDVPVAGCSTWARCMDGTRLTCTGMYECFNDVACFVYCDGNIQYCPVPCP